MVTSRRGQLPFQNQRSVSHHGTAHCLLDSQNIWNPTRPSSGQVSSQPLSLTMVPKHKPAVPHTTQDQFCFEPSTATRIRYKPETWSCENQWTALQTSERKRLSVSAGGTNPAADPFCVSIARPALGLCPRISVYMSDISISSNINIIGDR